MSKNLIQTMIGKMINDNVVKPLIAGECGLKEDELIAMGRLVCHIEKDIEETCLLCNGCSPRTLERWIEDKSIGFPKWHKGVGDKHYFWLDEIEFWKMEHKDILERVEKKKKIF